VALNDLRAAALASALALLSACGGGGDFSCDAHSKCSADPPVTQAKIDSCSAAATGACAVHYKALGTCMVLNQKCAADHTTDDQATLEACEAELGAMLTCCMTHSGAPGCN
jgi:hypothetical protein